MFTNKKIDLHLHFDGSLSIEHAWQLAQDMEYYQGMSKETFCAKMQLDENCHSLYDYLARFEAPLSLLQVKQALYTSMQALIQTLAQQGLCYAEIRFAPQQHTKQGLTQEDVVITLLKAVKDAAVTIPEIKINVIACMMILGEEKITHDENLETLRLMKKYYNKGLCALDLAGAEGFAPMEDFAYFFEEARNAKIPFTIHAGESFGPANIETAIAFGAKRIGHGTTAIQDERVMQLLKEKQIPLEMCISSNVDCEVVPSFEDHPIHKFLSYGIPVTINTDNMTISNTTLDKEYARLQQYLGFHEEDIHTCLITSLSYAFLSDEERLELAKKIYA